MADRIRRSQALGAIALLLSASTAAADPQRRPFPQSTDSPTTTRPADAVGAAEAAATSGIGAPAEPAALPAPIGASEFGGVNPDRTPLRVSAHPLLAGAPGVFTRPPGWTLTDPALDAASEILIPPALPELLARSKFATGAFATAFEDDGLAQLVLAAGATTPEGLPAERRKERELERERALEELAARIESADVVQTVGAIHAVLWDRDAPTEAWVASARAVGRLGWVDSVVPLRSELNLTPYTYRAAAARRALRDIYGLWFETPEQLDAFRQGEQVQFSGAVRRALLDAEQQVLNRDRELFTLEPTRALDALDDVSPRVRGAAAAALANAARSGQAQVDSDGGVAVPEVVRAARRLIFEAGGEPWNEDGESSLDVAQLLFAQVEFESDTEALCMQIGALVELLEGAAPDSVHVRRTKDLLENGVGAAPMSMAICLGRAIARLPYTTDDASGVDSVARGFGMLERLFTSIAGGPQSDADLAIGLLGASRRLSRGDSDASAIGAEILSESVLALVESSRAESDVRLAAVAAMRDLARPGDGVRLAKRLVADRDDAAFAFAILGVLDSFARNGAERDLTPELRVELANAARALLDHEDADLRRRALELLSRPSVESEIVRADLFAMLEGLAADDDVYDREQRALLLGLVGRHGDGQVLARMLEPGALERLLTRNPELLLEFADGVAALGSMDRALGIEAFERLLASGVSEDLRPELLTRALTWLVATERQTAPADAEQIASPVDADLALHRRVLGWALELERVSSPWALPNFERAALFQRVLEQHVSPLESIDAPSPRSLARLLAAAGAPTTEVEASFAEARAGGDDIALDLERARYLFRASAGVYGPALDAYRAIVEPVSIATIQPLAGSTAPAVPASLNAASVDAWRDREGSIATLESGDLRAVVMMASEVAILESPEPTAAWQIAGMAGLELLARPSWDDTDSTAALLDLERVGAALIATGDAEDMIGLFDLIEARRDEVEDTEADTAGPWPELFGDVTSRARVGKLRDQLSNALAPPFDPEQGTTATGTTTTGTTTTGTTTTGAATDEVKSADEPVTSGGSGGESGGGADAPN